ncbi:hypothetical protein AB0N99_30810 [Streptomyces sp. NPDC093272]
MVNPTVADPTAEQPAEPGPSYGWWDETPAEAGRQDRSWFDREEG